MSNTISISNGNFIQAIAGTIYAMHPYHLPEDIDVIMKQVRDKLDAMPDCNNTIDNTFKLFRFTNWEDVHKFVKDLVYCKEFEALNESRKSKDGKGKDPDIVFTSRYDSSKLETRYTDFIDLDVCTGNITNYVISLAEESDCFLCLYAKSYGSTKHSNSEICSKCTINPDFSNNYKIHPLALKPHNKWTDEEKKMYGLD